MLDLSSRVEILEREVRAWRRVGVMAIMGAVVLGGIGAARNADPAPIEGEEFVLKKTGSKHAAARLYLTEKGIPSLALYKQNAQGTSVSVASMSLDEDGMPWLLLQDKDGNPTFEVDSKLGHTTQLKLRGQGGSHIELSAGKDGTKISAHNGKAETIIHKSP